MKKFTLFIALFSVVSFSNAQGLQGIIVEKYYLSDANDSLNAVANGAVTPLRKGSTTYRVFIDMAPGYKFLTLFGNSSSQTIPPTVLHPLVIKTSTDFYNDPNNGQIFPQANSVTSTKKNTTLIDSWLSVGGVCAGKMGVLKTEDTDGSIGNSNGVLTNTLGGVFGAAINSVVPGAQDGLMPGTPVVPTAITLGNATDVFDQTAGNTFSVTDGAIAALGGAVGVTPSNMILIGQFTTNGILSFSLNIQIQNTLTLVSEVYVPSNPTTTLENVFPSLSYSSATTPTTPTNDVGISKVSKGNEAALFSIYPNPSQGNITLTIVPAKESSLVSYTIYDAVGNAVYGRNLGKISGKYSESLDLSNLGSGLYFMSLSTEGNVTTSRFVKE